MIPFASVTFLFLVLLCYANSGVSADLAERFNITEPKFEYSDLRFSLEYGVSDFVEGIEFVGYELYDTGCRYNDGDPPNPVTLETTVTIREIADLLDKTVGLEIIIDPDSIQADPYLWDEATSQVQFCVRMMLFVDGSIEVNFLETVIYLDVDLTDGFEVTGFGTSAKERIQKNANMAYDVEAYLCDKYNNQIIRDMSTFEENFNKCAPAFPGEKPEEVYNQGHSIRICVRPTEASLRDGVYMRQIRSMYFERVDDPTIRQTAVHAGQPAAHGLSNVYCVPNLCVVDTILNAQFFHNAGKAAAYGVALLQYGTERQEPLPDCILRRRMDSELSEKDYRANENHYAFSEGSIERRSKEVPLDKFWNLTRPTFDYGNLNFKLYYTVSDGIGANQVQVEVWDRYCESGGKGVTDDILLAGFSDTVTTGDGSGFQEMEVDLAVQTNSLESLLASGVYAESCDGAFAQINACVRTQLHNNEAQGGHEVNFLETPVILNVDFESGGSFGLNLLVMGSEDYCDLDNGFLTELNSIKADAARGKGGLMNTILSMLLVTICILATNI